MNKLIEWLGKLRCEAFYFEPSESGEYAYKNYTEKEFINFILEHSILKKSQLIGPTKVQKNLYLLTP